MQSLMSSLKGVDMNRIYKNVFNVHTGTWVAVQETAKSQGKKSVKSSIVSAVTDIKTGASTFALASSLGALLLLASPVGHALDIGSDFSNTLGTAAIDGDPGDVAIGGGQRQLPMVQVVMSRLVV